MNKTKLSNEQVEALAKVAGVEHGISGQDLGKAITKLTNLTPNVFFTDILDTLNLEDNPFGVFVKNDVMFGNRVRYVSTGIIASQEWAQGKYTPDLMGSKVAPDYEDFSTSLIKSAYPLIYNEPEMTNYFKDYNNLTELMNQIRAVNNQSYKVELINMFLYIFGNTTVDLPAYMKTELDKTTAKMLNVQDLGTQNDMKAVFKEIVKLANKMGGKGVPANKDYNIGFTKGTTIDSKINRSVPSQDLVLIISRDDLIDLSQEISTIYHQSFYQGDNKFYQVIEADIPKGTAWLLDKETVRFNPKLQRTTSEQWMDLSITITGNIWTHAGVFKYGNGVKITYLIKAA